MRQLRLRKQKTSYRIFSYFIIFSFVFTSIIPPNAAAQLASTSSVTLSNNYIPAHVKGLTINPKNPLEFDFLIDSGDSGLIGEAFKKESEKLVKYFLASLTVPEDEMWVNLSPYEKGRIITEKFGQTQMGHDLLSQDYILKQLTAGLMSPDEKLGKDFWKKVRAEVRQQQIAAGETSPNSGEFGGLDIVNALNKVWIVPDRTVVYERGDTAFVVDSHLKVEVMSDQKDITELDNVVEISEIMKNVLIPAIEKEVNEGKNFANLRQVYNSMILAAWYKKNLRESLLGKVYADKNKVRGIDDNNQEANQKIYQQYVDAFNKGAYNLVKEEYDPNVQQVIQQKYFIGGMDNSQLTENLRSFKSPQTSKDFALIQKTGETRGMISDVKINLFDVGPKADIDHAIAPEAERQRFDKANIATEEKEKKVSKEISEVKTSEIKSGLAQKYLNSNISTYRQMLEVGFTPQQLALRGSIKNFLRPRLSEDVTRTIDGENNVNSEIIGKHLKELAEFKRINASDAVSKYLITSEISKKSEAMGIVDDVQDLTAFLIETYGMSEQKEKYLTPHLEGKDFIVYALTGNNHAGTDALSGITTTAQKDGDDYIIKGGKHYITVGMKAKYAIVFADLLDMPDPSDPLKIIYQEGRAGRNKRITAFIVPLNDSKVTRTHMEMIGQHGSGTTEIFFNDVRVPKKDMLGKPGQGAEISMKGLEPGRISIGAVSLGSLLHTTDTTIEAYQKLINEKSYIDVPQWEAAIKHFILDAYAAQSFLTYTAMMRDQKQPYNSEAAMVKGIASELAVDNTIEAMQLIGPSSLVKSHSLEQFVRDDAFLTKGEGTTEGLRKLIKNDVIRKYKITLSKDKQRTFNQDFKFYLDNDLLPPEVNDYLIQEMLPSKLNEQISPDKRRELQKVILEWKTKMEEFQGSNAVEKTGFNAKDIIYIQGVIQNRIIDLMVDSFVLGVLKDVERKTNDMEQEIYDITSITLRHRYEDALDQRLKSYTADVESLFKKKEDMEKILLREDWKEQIDMADDFGMSLSILENLKGIEFMKALGYTDEVLKPYTEGKKFVSTGLIDKDFKSFVINGKEADAVILLSQGKNIFILDKDKTDWKISDEKFLGLNDILTVIDGSNAKFQESPRGSDVVAAWQQMRDEEKKALVYISRKFGEKMIQKGFDYANQRESMGKKIYEFADVRHLIETSKQLLSGMNPENVTRNLVNIAKKMVQVHGGAGYSQEMPISRDYLNAITLSVLESDRQRADKSINIEKEVDEIDLQIKRFDNEFHPTKDDLIKASRILKNNLNGNLKIEQFHSLQRIKGVNPKFYTDPTVVLWNHNKKYPEITSHVSSLISPDSIFNLLFRTVLEIRRDLLFIGINNHGLYDYSGIKIVKLGIQPADDSLTPQELAGYAKEFVSNRYESLTYDRAVIKNTYLEELKSSLEAALKVYSNVHRGEGAHSQASTELFELALNKYALEYFGLDSNIYTVIAGNRRNIEAVKAQFIKAKLPVANEIYSSDIGLDLGMGFMVVRREDLKKVMPDQFGGGIVDASINKYVFLKENEADRFMPGTPSIVLAIVFAKALSMVQRENRNKDLFKITGNGFSKLDVDELFQISDDLIKGEDNFENLRKSLVGIESKVPTKNGARPYINLDNGASTPAFQTILDTAEVVLMRGSSISAEEKKALIDKVTQLTTDFLDVPKNYEVLFSGNTTDAENIIAKVVKKYAQNIKSDSGEDLFIYRDSLGHNSGTLPFLFNEKGEMQDHDMIPIDKEGFYKLDEFEKTLKEYNSGLKDTAELKPRIRFLNLTAASNVFGVVNDLKPVIEIAKRNGVKMVAIDAAQAFSHNSISIKELNEAGIRVMLVNSAHKAYAPFGVGELIIPKEFYGLLDQSDQQKIKKYGEENLVGIAAIGKSIALFQVLTMKNIVEHEIVLMKRIHEHADKLVKTYPDLFEFYGPKDPTKRRGVFTFNLLHIPHDVVSKELAQEFGIGTRAGCFCAGRAVAEGLNISDDIDGIIDIAKEDNFSTIPGMVRISVGAYSSEEDVDAFFAALEQIIQSNPTSLERSLAKQYLTIGDNLTKERKSVMTKVLGLSAKNIEDDYKDYLLRTQFSSDLFSRYLHELQMGVFGTPVGIDHAIAEISDKATYGGIDFNPQLLDMQIKRDGKGIPLPFEQQPLLKMNTPGGSMNIEGFLPVIIKITPVINFPLLLGLDNSSTKTDHIVDADQKQKSREVDDVETPQGGVEQISFADVK